MTATLLYFPDIIQDAPFHHGHTIIEHKYIQPIVMWLSRKPRPDLEMRAFMAHLAHYIPAKPRYEVISRCIGKPSTDCELALYAAMEGLKRENELCTRYRAKFMPWAKDKPGSLLPKDVLIWLARRGTCLQIQCALIGCSQMRKRHCYQFRLTQKRIANRVCRSQAAVSKAIGKMVAAGILLEWSEGREKVYSWASSSQLQRLRQSKSAEVSATLRDVAGKANEFRRWGRIARKKKREQQDETMIKESLPPQKKSAIG